MTHAVWVQTLAALCRNVRTSAIYVLGENVSHAEARQRSASMIQKYLGVRAEVDPPLLTKGRQDLRSLRPQWAVALFTAFSKQAELARARELQVARPEVDYLLHTGSSVKQGRQQYVVPTAVRG